MRVLNVLIIFSILLIAQAQAGQDDRCCCLYAASRDCLPGFPATQCVVSGFSCVPDMTTSAPTDAPTPAPTVGPEPIPQTPFNSIAKNLKIYFFSDFYSVEGVEGGTIGGMARLASILKADEGQKIVAFGGDLFGPSGMSTFFGAPDQMVDTFNHVGVDVAVPGNHEFDKGLDHAEEAFNRFDCEWVQGNIYTKGTTDPLPGLKGWTVIDRDGLRVGFFGVVLDVTYVTKLEASDVDFEEPLAYAKRTAAWMRERQGCDFIVALTHLDIATEKKLLEQIPDIDLVLGGHDHTTEFHHVSGRYMVEGGTDLDNLVVFDISYIPNTRPLIRAEQVHFKPMDSSVSNDPETQAMVDEFIERYDREGAVVIGQTLTELRAGKSAIRTIETNAADWAADALREWGEDVIQSSGAEQYPIICLQNTGGLRWHQNIPAGDLAYANMFQLHPYGNKAVILLMTGEEVRRFVEHGVSRLPAAKGEFPSVSGIEFTHHCYANPDDVATNNCDDWDPDTPRVTDVRQYGSDIQIQDDEIFYVVTHDYLSKGNDGYTFLVDLPRIVSPSNAPLILDIWIETLKATTPINPQEDGRIKQLGAPNRKRSFTPPVRKRDYKIKQWLDQEELKRARATVKNNRAEL